MNLNDLNNERLVSLLLGICVVVESTRQQLSQESSPHLKQKREANLKALLEDQENIRSEILRRLNISE